MDEIEAFLVEQPWLGTVVDFESEIWGDQGRLSGAEIGSNYLNLLE